MKRKLLLLSCLIYIGALCYTAYLISYRCDYLPWGVHSRDGLYMLDVFFVILPVLLVMSIARFFTLDGSIYVRSGYLIQLPVIAVLSFAGAQASSPGQVVVILLLAILILINLIDIRMIWKTGDNKTVEK